MMDIAWLSSIYEYMDNGNFQEYLLSEKAENLSWEKRLHIAIDSAQGWSKGKISLVQVWKRSLL